MSCERVVRFDGSELDDLICDLLCCGQHGLTKTVRESALVKICHGALEVFREQEMMVELDGPVNVCGDIHGQYGDLLRLFDKCGFPPDSNYLFLGDYVDRGPNSIETVSLLFCYKLKYPYNVFLLRGNHETRAVNQMYGFNEECQRRYSARLYAAFSDTFSYMPLTALIGDRILCMHGGIAPNARTLDQMRNIKRPLEPAGQTIEMDLLWSDPLPGIKGFIPNKRGASVCFGEDALNEKLQLMDVDMVVRGHQVVQDGFEFFANRKLVTVFSAPHYCGQFNNAGAVMKVTEDLQCSFVLLKPYMMDGEREDKEIDTVVPERERVGDGKEPDTGIIIARVIVPKKDEKEVKETKPEQKSPKVVKPLGCQNRLSKEERRSVKEKERKKIAKRKSSEIVEKRIVKEKPWEVAERKMLKEKKKVAHQPNHPAIPQFAEKPEKERTFRELKKASIRLHPLANPPAPAPTPIPSPPPAATAPAHPPSTRLPPPQFEPIDIIIEPQIKLEKYKSKPKVAEKKLDIDDEFNEMDKPDFDVDEYTSRTQMEEEEEEAEENKKQEDKNG
ncbi:unnamed protein product [Bursaphelenchus xylophilus]|uniref:Serine/threonine-protein phosphatase n=1 Tax=Bursaphelenchus xylophilus TaxID=6326 RepID=A0A1I7S6V0_BURXY|nr:unnamed protein product [Bursaphelenchus xylophilus]CAG9079740.1 unnamed protein product [Bursaphelenchus xylophilus]